MTAASLAMAMHTGLPPLRGRLLWLYRAAWLALAVGAVLVHAMLLATPAMQPTILMLRLIKAGIIFAVVTLLFRQRQRDPVAAILCLAFLTWTITSSFDFSAKNVLPLVLDRARFLLFALALLLFPDGEWRPPWGRHVAVASAVVTVIGILEVFEVLRTHLFLPLAIACVLAAVAALLECFRTAASEVLRQQMKWVALGLVLGITLILSARAGAALSRGAPALALPTLWEGLFQTGIVIIAAGFLISLLRYRLFDAETAISRSAAYAALTVVLVAIFAATEATIENVGQTYFGMGLGNVSAAAAAAVAAVLLNPLHERIGGWAEQRFQRDLVRLKTELPVLLDELAASFSTRELGAAALQRICEAIHATRASLLVNGSIIATLGLDQRTARRSVRRQPHPEDSGTVLFPVSIAMRCPFGGTSGWLLLGPRPDGSLYGKDDQNAVQHVLAPLRRALVMAIARDTVRSENVRAGKRLARKIEDLERRIFASNGASV